MSASTTYYQQATTGVLHKRRNCSITRRTRYSHFERTGLTAEQVAAMPHCAKCWGDEAGLASTPQCNCGSRSKAAHAHANNCPVYLAADEALRAEARNAYRALSDRALLNVEPLGGIRRAEWWAEASRRGLR